ncbi:TPA: HNH endonuclease, partial [Enterobacter sichuanensis]|nr:HNH endonuclease [Enterobacter sichuanensis]
MSDVVSLEELKRLFFYDHETGNFYRLKSIRNLRKGDIAGSLNKSGYIEIYINSKRYRAHRLAIFYMTGRWPKAVDHKNRIRNDNRWCNIRPCTL